MTTSHEIATTDLPATVRAFLSAQEAGRPDAAVRTFLPSATVVDEGHTYRGTEEILTFLQEAGSEFTFTTELTRALRVDATHWVAHHRLEGDFPGGVAELDYRFALVDDLIEELVIAP